MADPILVIACGALARELTELKRTCGWQHLRLRCLDARLHNTPAAIPAAVEEAIREDGREFAQIFVAYADCGTGGALDRVLAAHGIERLPGAHCYEFLAGASRFAALAAAEPGTFYLTDFLARNVERLVIRPLGLDDNPELRDAYFGNYRRLVYLSQLPDATLASAARDAAARLGLEYEHIHCGLAALESAMTDRVSRWGGDPEDYRLLA